MNVAFDSFVFIDLFLRQGGEKEAEDRIKQAIEGKVTPVISSVCLLEVKYSMRRKAGVREALAAVKYIKGIPKIRTIPADDLICEAAAELRDKYYSKERQLSYADAIHLATAITTGCDKIITGDPDFKGIEEIEAEIY